MKNMMFYCSIVLITEIIDKSFFYFGKYKGDYSGFCIGES